jgi:hypothetical protein
MSNSSSYKQDLSTLLLAQHGSEQRVWSSLSDEQKSALGQVDDWSAKDHIAHVTYWREVFSQRLRAALSGGEVPPPDPDFLQTNDAVFEEHKDDAWGAVMNWARQAQDELIDVIEGLDNSTLADDESFEFTNGRPLWQYIALGEGYHSYAHLCDVLVIAGEFEEAERIQLELYEALITLDDSTSWHGSQRYNLACFYALHERPERAIELLGESFAMNSALIDWSQQDGDLDSLRELPAFQALYPQEG